SLSLFSINWGRRWGSRLWPRSFHTAGPRSCLPGSSVSPPLLKEERTSRTDRESDVHDPERKPGDGLRWRTSAPSRISDLATAHRCSIRELCSATVVKWLLAGGTFSGDLSKWWAPARPHREHRMLATQ